VKKSENNNKTTVSPPTNSRILDTPNKKADMDDLEQEIQKQVSLAFGMNAMLQQVSTHVNNGSSTTAFGISDYESMIDSANSDPIAPPSTTVVKRPGRGRPRKIIKMASVLLEEDRDSTSSPQLSSETSVSKVLRNSVKPKCATPNSVIEILDDDDDDDASRNNLLDMSDLSMATLDGKMEVDPLLNFTPKVMVTKMDVHEMENTISNSTPQPK
jgi:hypothetical protein